jgi:chromosome segregation ATPase
LVCKNLEVAVKVARDSDLDCVTLDGDKVNRKGALTGGFHDQRTSRLRCNRRIEGARTRLVESREQQNQIKLEKDGQLSLKSLFDPSSQFLMHQNLIVVFLSLLLCSN